MKKPRLTSESDHRAQFPHIPQELILQEILPRLPVKTLTRFKTVCKSWHAFISFDQQFSKSHLKHSADQGRVRFMFVRDSHSTLAYAAPEDIITTSTMVNKPIHVEEYSEDDGAAAAHVDFLASCDGLCCISNTDEDEFFLWNPSTRESRRIPGSRIEFPKGYGCAWASVFFGLGYDSGSCDYKLVRIAIFHMFDCADFRTEVKIYSRKSDSWRRIEDFPYDFPHGRPGVFVSGGLHWIVSLWRDDVRYHMVVVLDVKRENYGLIQLPEFEKDKVVYFDIGNLGENLVFFCSYLGFRYDIWMLKEYKKPESWMRIKIVEPCMTNIETVFYFQPLILAKPDGEILIRIGEKKFAVHDVKKKLCLDILIPRMIREAKIVSFVESLVSPNAH